jgi:hypothetical protein
VPVFTQGSTVADAGEILACSGGELATTPRSIEISFRSIPVSSTPQTVEQTAPAKGVRGVMMQTKDGEPGLSTWPESDWEIELNVSTANPDWVWVGARICRLASDDTVRARIGEVVGQRQNLRSVATYTMTVHANESLGAATDTAYAVLYFDVSGSAAPSSFAFTPDSLVYAHRIPRVEVVDESLDITEAWKGVTGNFDGILEADEDVDILESVTHRTDYGRIEDENVEITETATPLLRLLRAVDESVDVTEGAETALFKVTRGFGVGTLVLSGTRNGKVLSPGAQRGLVLSAGARTGKVFAA